MTDTSSTAPRIHWWQSRTIWSAIVAIISGVAVLLGHNIDPGTQAKLVDDATNGASALGEIASIATVYFRAKANAPITKQILPAVLGGTPEPAAPQPTVPTSSP